MSKLPWYKEGLNFKCTECGKCCTGAPGYVWVSEQEMVAIAEHLQLSLDVFKRKYTRQSENRYALVELRSQNNDCVFLEGKSCAIYTVRPKQCRTFPFWKENLRSEESWKCAADICEGINANAPVIPLEIIEAQASS